MERVSRSVSSRVIRMVAEAGSTVELPSWRPASRTRPRPERRSVRRRVGRRSRSTRPAGSRPPPGRRMRFGACRDYRPGPAASLPRRTRPTGRDARHYAERPTRPARCGAPLGGSANVAKVTMPQLGESVAEGTIGKWLKQPGDHVAKYEPLVEVVTDKVNAEVPSPFEGILREILVEEGATVPNNAEIAVIETADDGAGRWRRGRRPDRRPVVTSEPTRRRRAASPRRPTVAAGPAGSDERGPAEMPAAASRRARRHGGRRGAAGHRRPRRPDDARRPPPAARARPVAGADHGHRRRRPDHPRGRPQGRRGDPDGHALRPHRRPAPAPDAAPSPTAAAPAGPDRSRAGAPIEFPDGADEVLAADDPDAQGHRRADDARPPRAARLRPHGGRRDRAGARARDAPSATYQAREGISLSYVPFVIKAAVDALRRYPAFNAHWTDAGPAGQAAHQHGRRRRGR